MRFDTVGLSCELGRVADLSASGMRLLLREKTELCRGMFLQLALSDDHERMIVPCQVRWVRKQKGEWQAGFEFLGLTDAMMSRLWDMGKACAADARPGDAKAANPAPAQPASDAPGIKAEIEDLYRLLGVTRHADAAAIKAAYRELAKKLHPDHNSDPEAHRTFSVVSKAYAVLRDPDKKARYDAMLSRYGVAA